MRFADLLYGTIELPEWLTPFLRLPEFIRLRGVRLSNVDSVYFKDFSGAARWEHGVAVAALAYRCATRRGLSERERAELTLAGLLHDVGTPPFAHTAESVLANFDHEIEGQRLLTADMSGDSSPDGAIFESQLPQFIGCCRRTSQRLGVRLDPDEVAKHVAGEGDLGFLINGSIDLDSADNVTRASLFTGAKVCADVPLGVADWLALQDHMVTDLDTVDNSAVRQWVVYRNELYTSFYEADETELGRTGFLQHLMRRALDAGMQRAQLIWTTDEDLMDKMAAIDDTAPDDFRPALSELVQRYRLLETPCCLARVPIHDEATLRTLRHPDAVSWITRRLRSARFEPMILVMSRRFPASYPKTLLPEAAGTVFVFQLGAEAKTRELERQIRAVSPACAESGSSASVASLLDLALRAWALRKPWSEADPRRKRDVKAALESVGDWGFRLSRNDSFHAYPSTFVHALPANLLVALGMRDDLILDPFGGTGQTAIESIKYGNGCVTADVNTVACLAAKARLTYLPAVTRQLIRDLDEQLIRSSRPGEAPILELLDEWFHPKTVSELTMILGFIQSRRDDRLQTFFKACLSAILPSCTARKGEQHGYFADNCPLPKGADGPPYQPAVKLFLDRTRQALTRVERLYGLIEQQGRETEAELARVVVRQVDVSTATPSSYGLEEGQVGAIVTSPPYLCMADYALGQRLSYEWLAPTLLEADFQREMGARRLRSRRDSELVIREYKRGLESFAALAGRLVRNGGYVGVVLGQPLAKQFRSAQVTTHLDAALEANGFEHLWHVDRRIHWHRNHGYARLKTERVSVHIKA